MILFLYNMGLIAVLVLGAPWWLWRLATTQKYRAGLRQRLGFVPRQLVRTINTRWGLDVADEAVVTNPVVWLHAVSVGEVLAVSHLITTLDEKLPQITLVVSTTTRTGYTLAQERFGADRVFYCPLDLPWAVAAYLKTLKPRLLVLAETEFWPNLLTSCFSRSIPVVVVNARISDRSWPRYQRLERLWQPFLSGLTLVLAQTAKDAERLKALGCNPARVTVSGNLKFDVRITHEAEAARLLRQLTDGLKLLVAGSTLEGEETILLEALPALLAAEPRLVMVIAPRHPERFGAVTELLERSDLRWRPRSKLSADAAPLVAGEIVLLDSIGELASVYSLAAVAFIGGSLVPAGGHNPLEPAQFGVPVVMGKFDSNFLGITSSLKADNAIWQVERGELASMTGALLRDTDTARKMGERGRRVFEKEAGATERTVAAIQEILARRGND
jgi:3-deoxy-D-manno-octulosonic-acid transferase